MLTASVEERKHLQGGLTDDTCRMGEKSRLPSSWLRQLDGVVL